MNLLSGRLHETLAFDLSGSGEHVWLRLRKYGINTEYLARALARIAGVPPRAVGYAGLKDRHAVTSQWFSVQLPGREVADWQAGLPDGVELLAAVRHTRKLQRGALAGNRFTIRLRDCAGDRTALTNRLQTIAQHGASVPRGCPARRRQGSGDEPGDGERDERTARSGDHRGQPG